MIYGYKYKKHKIELFNSGLMYFFEQLFIHDAAKYDENLLLEASFIPLVKKSKTRIEDALKEIVFVYHSIPDKKEKNKVKQAFKNNNEIEKLCQGKLSPLKYDDLDKDLSSVLKPFFIMIWEEYAQNDAIKAKCGEVREHFNSFVDPLFQKALICPFCGLEKLKPSGGKYRDAYDHYIPKTLYPFTSFNFKNLFPICGECNSDEKKREDTLYLGANRRRIFYPFDSTISCEKLEVEIKVSTPYDPKSKKTLLADKAWDYSLEIDGKTDQRLKSWDEIFHIKRRYKEYMKSFEKEWFDQVKGRFKISIEDKVSFSKFKSRLLDETQKEVTSMPMGVMRHSYFKYLLSSDNIEDRLKKVVAK